MCRPHIFLSALTENLISAVPWAGIGLGETDIVRFGSTSVNSIFIGLSVSLKIKPNFVCSLIGVVSGGVVYYIVYNFVILLGLKTDYLKMLSAIIVALFLGIPYVKAEYFTKHEAPRQKGGSGDA